MSNYRERIQKIKSVYLNGNKIDDLAQEPAFQGAIDCIDQYYELQESNPEVHTFINENGRKAPMSMLIPRSLEDLKSKRSSYKEVSDLSFGMLGRTPDFMNAGLAALSAHSEVLGSGNYTDYSANAKAYYNYVRDHNLFVGHAAINPQIDRSVSLGQQTNNFAGVHVVSHDSSGIVVTGAKMIVTLAPISDEILIFNMPGLKTGDEDYALAFALPVDTPGVKMVCRKTTVKESMSVFDHPLANKFDEIDAYLLLEEVFVPWDRVLVFRDVEMSNKFYDKTYIRHHTGHQGIVRAVSKAEILTGTAIKLAKMLKLDQFINVQEKLGELTSSLELLKASIVLSEEEATVSEKGIITPSINAIQAIRYNFPKMYEKMVKHIQSLAAGSMLASPHYNDFMTGNKDALNISLSTGETSAVERTKLLNLAWDISGDSFGQRQLVYERYHAGDPMRIAANHYLSYDKTTMLEMVEDALNEEVNKVRMPSKTT